MANFSSYRAHVAFDASAFGRRVATARVWVGLKPKELASRLGKTSEAINAIERGDRKEPPDKLLLEALARELGQPAEWLLAGDAPPWLNATTPAGSAELLERARLQAIRLADEAEALADLLVPGKNDATG